MGASLTGRCNLFSRERGRGGPSGARALSVAGARLGERVESGSGRGLGQVTTHHRLTRK